MFTSLVNATKPRSFFAQIISDSILSTAMLGQVESGRTCWKTHVCEMSLLHKSALAQWGLFLVHQSLPFRPSLELSTKYMTNPDFERNTKHLRFISALSASTSLHLISTLRI
jgi:hypothetical protein